MEHSFDIDIANEVGVHAAVIFNNFCYWILLNEKNERNFHDGKYWVYNSNKALILLFPYLTASQITTAVDKLKKNGYLVIGNYNETKYDRTLWYAFGEKGFAFCNKAKSICEKSKMDSGKFSNPFAKNPEPIPNINHIVNKDSKNITTLSTSPMEENNQTKEEDLPDWLLPSEEETDKGEKFFPPSNLNGERKEINNSPPSLHDDLKKGINELFHRRENTLWSKRELQLLKEVEKRPEILEEWKEIKELYSSGYQYRRKDIATLLNNWTTELDRAKNRYIKQERKLAW